MSITRLFLFLTLIAISNVRTQIVEIRGDLQTSMIESLKYPVIRDAMKLLALRNEHFNHWTKLICHLNSSKSLTFNTIKAISSYDSELTRQRRLCVEYIGTKFYLKWYNDLRTFIDKTYMATRVNDAVESFIATLTGKKLVRCWLAGRDAAKKCIQYSLASYAFANVTKLMVEKYTSLTDEVKALIEDARASINVADTVNYYLSRKNETIWKALTSYIETVEFFSNDQVNATKEVLDATFDQQLPKCEATLTNMTECLTAKATTKTPTDTAPSE